MENYQHQNICAQAPHPETATIFPLFESIKLG
jgi:hypothetical protein